MKDFIQPILDLIKSLITPQQGSKFLITALAIAAIYMLVSKSGELATDPSLLKVACGALAAMPVVYYVADFWHKNRGERPTEETPEGDPK